MSASEIRHVTSLDGQTTWQTTPTKLEVKPTPSSSIDCGRPSPLLGTMTEDRARLQCLGLKPWMIDFQANLPELPPDNLSNAEPQKAFTTHLVWDVEPDFENKILSAIATYRYTNKIPDNDLLVLDTQNLNIECITVDGEPAKYEIKKSEIPNKPDALRITLPVGKKYGDVTIKYKTTESATSIFWIDKEYTNGKQHPLLYTLFCPAEGASAIPGQFTPQVRQTYEVNVKTGNADLMALSSVSNNPTMRNDSGVYEGMKMGRAVPLYLLSLHVGNFSFRSYDEDPRTGVYSEDSMINEVYNAFTALPKFLKVAEDICGPYNWGTYTPILLPWAFPYMAMEHPCASTCGQICMECPSVIPHELAHSWTGNDITNCNWKQFFWNEGTTTFIEYMICEAIWGPGFAGMEFMYTLKEMQESIDEFRETRPDILRLCQQTDDFEFTRIPYAKGALFFFMLLTAMKERFFDFFKDYMKVFYQNTMSEERFLAFLQLWLQNEMQVEDFDAFMKEHQIHEWLHGTEIPSNAPKFESILVDMLNQEKAKVHNMENVNLDDYHFMTNYKGIPVPRTVIQANFLSMLHDCTPQQLEKLDAQMHFTKSTKMSIRGEWAHLCSKVGYLTPETQEMIVQFVIERNSKYKAGQIATNLSKSPEGRAVITSILEQDQGRLFPITRKALEDKLTPLSSSDS